MSCDHGLSIVMGCHWGHFTLTCNPNDIVQRCLGWTWQRRGSGLQSFFHRRILSPEIPLSIFRDARWLNAVGFKHCVDFAGVFRDEDYIAFVMGLAEAWRLAVHVVHGTL